MTEKERLLNQAKTQIELSEIEKIAIIKRLDVLRFQQIRKNKLKKINLLGDF